MRLSQAMLVVLASAACTSPTESDTICSEATIAVEACLGAPPEQAFTDCNAEEQQTAQGLLDGIEGAGCEAVPEGKTDSLFCELAKWDPLGWCKDPPPPLGPTPTGSATKFPIVLAHGFNTSTTNFWRFNDVDVALRADGHVVELGSVPPFDTPQVRAEFLADQIDALLERTGAAKVNLVCFSMGGIDCRFLVSPDGLGYGDKVATVTTISSPHRGSFVGDVAAALLPGGDRAAAIDALATMWGKTFSEVADDSHVVAALESISETRMAEFNATIADAPEVFYQSWAGVSSVAGVPNPKKDAEKNACKDDGGVVRELRHKDTRDVMDPLLVGGAAIVAHGLEMRPNDGVSTVESSKWGLFRGCIPADHLDQVGQIDDGGPDRHTGFDYLRFYRNLAFDLAARGH